MEVIFLSCGAGGPQLKRIPLGHHLWLSLCNLTKESLLLRANGAYSVYLVTVLAVACSGQTPVLNTPDRAALRAGVDSAADRLLAALRADASDSLLALLSDDVVIMPPNEAVLRGKPAVRTWYEHFLTQLRTSNLTVSDREVLIGGDWATEVAAFEWTLVPVAGGPPVIDHGSYMQAWHREPDGRWLFQREVWNSSTAPADPGKGR